MLINFYTCDRSLHYLYLVKYACNGNHLGTGLQISRNEGCGLPRNIISIM